MKMSKLFVSDKTMSYIRQLYPGSEAGKRIRLFGKEKSLLFTVIVAATVIVSVPVFIAGKRSHSTPVSSIERGNYGEGAKTVTLHARTESGYEEDIRVNVAEREYTKNELEKFSKELDDKLWMHILGSNTDPGNISYNLDLPDHVSGYPFTITWKTDRPLILGSSGVINNERLAEDDPEDRGVEVMLRATLQYNDHTEDKYSYVILHQNTEDETKNTGYLIEESIKESDEKSRTEKEQMLPSEASGRAVAFYEAGINKGWAVIFAGIMVAFISMAKKNETVRSQAVARRRQIESDYTRILDRYVLYYTAGMNPRAIWNGICKRYEEETAASPEARRYAYEEMTVTKKMMDEGMGEVAAYDDFARRIGDPGFRTFISFVKQTVVKGGSGLDEVIYEELEKARSKRLAMVREEASTAQTKLLLPMFMMLFAVLVIVMVSAFIGMEM